jgi:hypothetical protein
MTRFCLTDPRRLKKREAPGWQGGETKLYPQRYIESKPTPPAWMPRDSASGDPSDRT